MDPYKVLGLTKGESDQALIKKNYHKLVLKHHPDKHQGTTTGQFVAVQQAYELLSDPVKKDNFDKYGKSTVTGTLAGTRAAAPTWNASVKPSDATRPANAAPEWNAPATSSTTTAGSTEKARSSRTAAAPPQSASSSSKTAKTAHSGMTVALAPKKGSDPQTNDSKGKERLSSSGNAVLDKLPDPLKPTVASSKPTSTPSRPSPVTVKTAPATVKPTASSGSVHAPSVPSRPTTTLDRTSTTPSKPVTMQTKPGGSTQPGVPRVTQPQPNLRSSPYSNSHPKVPSFSLLDENHGSSTARAPSQSSRGPPIQSYKPTASPTSATSASRTAAACTSTSAAPTQSYNPTTTVDDSYLHSPEFAASAAKYAQGGNVTVTGQTAANPTVTAAMPTMRAWKNYSPQSTQQSQQQTQTQPQTQVQYEPQPTVTQTEVGMAGSQYGGSAGLSAELNQLSLNNAVGNSNPANDPSFTSFLHDAASIPDVGSEYDLGRGGGFDMGAGPSITGVEYIPGYGPNRNTRINIIVNQRTTHSSLLSGGIDPARGPTRILSRTSDLDLTPFPNPPHRIHHLRRTGPDCRGCNWCHYGPRFSDPYVAREANSRFQMELRESEEWLRRNFEEMMEGVGVGDPWCGPNPRWLWD